MEKLIDRLRSITARQDRFAFDLRGNCLVDRGIVAAYRATEGSAHFPDLPPAIIHALAHDGIVGAWRDPDDGKLHFDSCRVFTDDGNAMRFARREHQRSVFNLNRMQEMPIPAALRQGPGAAGPGIA